jgi:hypothetical protein
MPSPSQGWTELDWHAVCRTAMLISTTAARSDVQEPRGTVETLEGINREDNHGEGKEGGWAATCCPPRGSHRTALQQFYRASGKRLGEGKSRIAKPHLVVWARSVKPKNREQKRLKEFAEDFSCEEDGWIVMVLQRRNRSNFGENLMQFEDGLRDETSWNQKGTEGIGKSITRGTEQRKKREPKKKKMAIPEWSSKIFLVGLGMQKRGKQSTMEGNEVCKRLA